MAGPQKSRYRVRNRHKYRGNADNVIARSSWERQFFRWCDENPKVVEFSSEEIVIPYKYEADGKWHRYFPDVFVKFSDGSKYLIEIKPFSQTIQPKRPNRITRRYKEEVLVWIKNKNKWLAAMEWARKNGMIFEVWSEKKLEKIGLKILNG